MQKRVYTLRGLTQSNQALPFLLLNEGESVGCMCVSVLWCMSVCGVKKKEETKKLIIYTLTYTHLAHFHLLISFQGLSFGHPAEN